MAITLEIPDTTETLIINALYIKGVDLRMTSAAASISTDGKKITLTAE